MTVQRTKIEIIENLNGSILDIGGGGEVIIAEEWHRHSGENQAAFREDSATLPHSQPLRI